MARAIDRAFGNTDWILLAEQKMGLPEAIKMVPPDHAEHLTGILHFLDSVQDAAEEDGFPVVFLTTDRRS